jgi:type VI secretion system secreted protein Hcp
VPTDIFFKFGDIQGESTDDRHRDEIDVLAWTWGLVQSGPNATGGGGGAGRAHFSDFSFTHHFDKASPNLMRACATGVHVNDAILTERKAGSGQQEFLIIRMSDVIVTSVQPSGSGSDDGPVEQVSVQCAVVDVEYRPQRADGSLDASIHFKYDIRANREG